MKRFLGGPMCPKRVIDGEALWRSEKLARLPEKVRPEYANWLPLARANGTFEADPRSVWSQVYACNRPDVSVENVASYEAEFNGAGMLFLWTAADGKLWGYWVGIDKPGRLPPVSRLKNRHEILGPEPPAKDLKDYMASHRLANGQPMVALGSGFGSGFGSGSGSGSLAGKRSLEEKSKPLRAQKQHSCPPSADAQNFTLLTDDGDTARFAEFAEAYPPERKPTGPDWDDALRIWKCLSLAEQLEATKALTIGLGEWVSWKEAWAEDEPRYIPAMAKFLRLKKWQGEPPMKKEKSDGKRKQPASPPEPKPLDENVLAVAPVWRYYLETLHKNPRLLTLTTVRKQKGLARLRECLEKTGGDLARAEGLMRCAVDALANSAWHMGQNPEKKKYDSWENNLFKNQEQLERWLGQS